MKVELLVNLKIGSGKILPVGTMFTDENGPIPEFITRRLKRGQARVVSEIKKVLAPVSAPATGSVPGTGVVVSSKRVGKPRTEAKIIRPLQKKIMKKNAASE